MTRDELIERMARAAIIEKINAEVCLSVLCGRVPGLADVIDGKAVIVPAEPALQELAKRQTRLDAEFQAAISSDIEALYEE